MVVWQVSMKMNPFISFILIQYIDILHMHDGTDEEIQASRNKWIKASCSHYANRYESFPLFPFDVERDNATTSLCVFRLFQTLVCIDLVLGFERSINIIIIIILQTRAQRRIDCHLQGCQLLH